MTDALPTLSVDDIAIDENDQRATATFVFADGVRFPLHISKHTLWRWAGATDAQKLRAAILQRSATLAKLAAYARSARKKELRL